MTTPHDLDDRLRAELAALGAPDQRRDLGEPLPDGGPLTGTQALALFDAQVTSRLLDLAGRWLSGFGEGYFTVESAGHEGDAAVAAALRPTDPALLHARSGAFYCLRAAQAAGAFPPAPPPPAPAADTAFTASPDAAPGAADLGTSPDTTSREMRSTNRDTERSWSESAPMGAVSYQDLDADPGGATVVVPDLPQPAPDDAFAAAARDVLRGIVASAEEPAAGGRAKVFGRADLAVVPTTSAAGSHLPRAVGLGLALERLRRGARPADGEAEAAPWPADAVVVCSFDDGAVDHATATAALHTTGWYDHAGLRIPVLFVCADSGASAEGWVAAALRSRPGIRYFAADGTDVAATYRVAAEAADWVRRQRRPAVLHLSTVRLMEQGDGDAARDPLLATARLLVTSGYAGGEELLARYDERGWQLRRVAEEVLDEPKLASPVEIVRELAPRRPVRVSRAVAEAAAHAAGPGAGARAEAFGGKPPELTGPLTLAQSINGALADGMLDHPGTAVFGHEVAARGGVYGVTEGLRDRFGAARVFDTLPDETSILGLGLGAGLAGLLPVPEIRHLTSLLGAEDQLRGEAATMRFLSRGAFRNPMVVRVPGLASAEGLGGHDRNDSSLGALRDVPGLVVAVPARPDDAAPMLRTCLAAARVDGSVCVFVEPIALYHVRDLYTDGDDEWAAEYAEPGTWADRHVPIGRARVYGIGSAEDLTIITFGNGVRMSLRAAATLAGEGVGSRVVDLRWLAPLPVADIIREASATGRVLVVDETRRTGGVGEGVLSALVDTGYVGAARRVAALDSFVPLGPAARQVLVSAEAITQGARTLLAR
ncbi:transketolase C-terminal domain-containing protein [Micromonospora tulbaghiae]|uniref:transketolase C-terminal domain-containing protein n=1 Tax=Micromonospora tulbaghiae TaxID=479978 RepID=UPI0036A55EDE